MEAFINGFKEPDDNEIPDLVDDKGQFHIFCSSSSCIC